MDINIDVKWQMRPGARLCCVLESPYITTQWDFSQFSSIDDNMKNDATVADIADNADTHLSWLPSHSLHTVTPGLWHQHWWNTQWLLSMSKISTSARKVKTEMALYYQRVCVLHSFQPTPKCSDGLNTWEICLRTQFGNVWLVTQWPEASSSAIRLSLCCHIDKVNLMLLVAFVSFQIKVITRMEIISSMSWFWWSLGKRRYYILTAWHWVMFMSAMIATTYQYNIITFPIHYFIN